MHAETPQAAIELFAAAMSAGDLDSALALYEPEATFAPQPGASVTGLSAIGEALGGFLALYGVYVAGTEGVAKAWVADHAPAGAAGTAYGLFAAATGGSLLVASVVAGLLWTHVAPAAPFVLGASSAGAGLVLLALLGLKRRRLTRGRPRG